MAITVIAFTRNHRSVELVIPEHVAEALMHDGLASFDDMGDLYICADDASDLIRAADQYGLSLFAQGDLRH